MIIVAALVLAVSRFLGKFDLEALFTFRFCYIDEFLISGIPSCIVLDWRQRLRSRPIYVFLGT